MKKGIIALSLILVVGLFSAFAYGDSPLGNQDFPRSNWGHMHQQDIDLNSEEYKQLIEERENYRNENLERQIQEKNITEEEAKTWREHFEYMDKFHEENGYLGGHCGGRASGGHYRGRNNNTGNNSGRHHMSGTSHMNGTHHMGW